MLALVERIAAFVQPFADLYSESKALSVGTAILHVGGLLAGGGLAIATDRAVLRTPVNSAPGQRRVLDDVAATHTLVLSALAVIVTSGLMFLAADVKTFAVSKVYWTKMGLVLLLFLNGLRLWRTEGRLRMSLQKMRDSEAMPAGDWQALRHGALASVMLWFTIMLLGVVLAGS